MIFFPLNTTTSLDEAIPGVDLVIEAVYEDIGVKNEIFILPWHLGHVRGSTS
ncbi:MAG: hypothetical protein IMF11_13410 [Proteobacteria bacterium]|nr:hypothetical protein [Pseudomonadota bacterium]